MNEPEKTRLIESRLIALEERTLHLDHLLGELNGVVCAMQNRLDAQNAAITGLAEAIHRRVTVADEKRTLEEEKPPHY